MCHNFFNQIKIIIYIIILLIATSIFSQEAIDVLEWSPVKDVPLYHIEIRDSNKKVVISEKVKETKFQIPLNALPEGKYEHRVGVYNKFEKFKGFSDWHSFIISIIKSPELNEGQQKVAYNKLKLIQFDVYGNNFFDVMKVSLMYTSTIEVAINNYKYIDKNHIYFEVDVSNLGLGSYKLVLENPKGAILVKEKFLKIEEDPKTLEEKKIAEEKAEREKKLAEENRIKNAEAKRIREAKYKGLYAMGKSAILPGWGLKNSSKDNWKYVAYPFIAGMILGTYYVNYENYHGYVNTYHESMNLAGYSLLSRNAISYLASQHRAESAYQHANTSSAQLELATLVLAGFYIYNLYSTYNIVSKEPVPTTPNSPAAFYQNENMSVSAKIKNPNYQLSDMKNPSKIDGMELEFRFRF